MSDVCDRTINRRRLLGATAGAGAAAVLANRAGAAPSRPAAPFVNRHADTVKLSLWEQFPELLEPFKKMLADFTAANPGIEIDVSMTPTDQWKAKLNTALSAGSGPDLWGAFARPQLDIDIQSGLIMDITGQIDLSQVIPAAQDAVTVEDKVWAAPSGRYTVGICYHQDLFDKAGITAEPATWDELRTAMETLKGKNITPYSIAVKDGSLSYFNYIGLASALLGQEGFDAVQAGTKKLNDEDGVRVIQEMRDWIPYYQPNFLGTVYAESKALFASKQTAMMDCGSADLAGYYEIDPNAQLGFFYWPSPDGVKKQVTNTGMSVMYAANAKLSEAKKDAAITFLRWVVSPEGAKSMNANISLLPVVQGVEPTGDPILTEMVNSPLDIPVWYERWPTLNIGQVWTEEGNAGFDTKTDPSVFATKLQDSVDKQMATPLATPQP
ncbi:MAG TPA: extracellular solute-binding protein [Thermomicrobiales bacterium]|jgi:raffinose/stachyose/melibiose transport system substrate-binding protein